MKKIDADSLIDLVDSLGLNERQQIGTLLNEVEAQDEEDEDEDEQEV